MCLLMAEKPQICFNMHELLRRKDLIYQLVLKDLKSRYSRPLLGIFWAFLYPFSTVLIFYLVFSIILKVRTEEVPFVLYLMSGVFPWSFFQESILISTTSLIDNKNLIKEANFPHYFIPLSIVLANLINFLPALFIVIILSIIILKGVSIFIIFLPSILIIHLLLTIGLSIIFSITCIRLPDIKYILNTFLLLLFYLTPAFYPLSFIKNSFSPLLFKIYTYNPFVIIMNLYRSVILKGYCSTLGEDIGLLKFVTVILITSLIFLLSCYLYRVNKDKINDYLLN